jgi:tetratricopeptide (TPR) repeat protein
MLEEYEYALYCFSRVHTLGDGGPRVRYWEGYARYKRGEHREAIGYLKQALASMPRHADAWVVMSNCHFMLGEFDDSVRCFRKAFNIDVQDINALLLRGMSQVKSGNLDEAIRCFSGVFGIMKR